MLDAEIYLFQSRPCQCVEPLIHEPECHLIQILSESFRVHLIPLVRVHVLDLLNRAVQLHL